MSQDWEALWESCRRQNQAVLDQAGKQIIETIRSAAEQIGSHPEVKTCLSEVCRVIQTLDQTPIPKRG